MISKIYSPCTLIDEPQLRILYSILVKVVSCTETLSFDDVNYLNEFISIFKLHLHDNY